MTPALNRAATSQTTVNNIQVQLGDVFSTQTLNVVDVSDSITAPNTATGNGVITSVVGGGVNVQSNQTMSGAAKAQTTISVAANAGAQTSAITSAMGNLNEVGSPDGGPVTGVNTQATGPGQILATSAFNATNAQTGAAALNVQAKANSYQLSVSDTAGSNTSANTTSTQTSSAQTEADGGAVLNYTPGTAAASAAAASNNLTGTGAGAAGQTLSATQAMTGPLTQATQSINLGNGQTIQSACDGHRR